MQQKVPIISSSVQHCFASLNMRFGSIFRARSSRCIYLPLSPRVHRLRCHLWSLLMSGHHFMILSYYLDLSVFLLCQTLLLCVYLPSIVTIIVIWPLFHHQAPFSLSSFFHFHCYLPCYHHPQPYTHPETAHEEPGGWSAVPCDWAIKQGSSSPLEHAAMHIGWFGFLYWYGYDGWLRTVNISVGRRWWDWRLSDSGN